MKQKQKQWRYKQQHRWTRSNSQTVTVNSPGQCVCCVCVCFVFVLVTHHLSSQLLDFWAAESFPSDSAADALVCSDREQKKNHWCLKLYLLYLYFTEGAEDTCSSEHVMSSLLFDLNYFHFAYNCLHVWYSDVINSQSKCRNWSLTHFWGGCITAPLIFTKWYRGMDVVSS